MAYGKSSIYETSYEYESSSSSVTGNNLGFKRLVYNMFSPHFEAPHQSSHDLAFADEQPNPCLVHFCLTTHIIKTKRRVLCRQEV